MRSTNSDRPQDQAEARAILAMHPKVARQIGNMSHQIEHNLINGLTDRAAVGEAVSDYCRELCRRLGYSESSELEPLLIDRIVVTWLVVQQTESDRRSVRSGATLTKAAFYHAMASRVQVDHSRAIVALARVRRLLRPRVTQVNIAAAGEQQVNALAVGAPADQPN